MVYTNYYFLKIFLKPQQESGTVENTYNPNLWEVKVGESWPVWATIDTF